MKVIFANLYDILKVRTVYTSWFVMRKLSRLTLYCIKLNMFCVIEVSKSCAFCINMNVLFYRHFQKQVAFKQLLCVLSRTLRGDSSRDLTRSPDTFQISNPKIDIRVCNIHFLLCLMKVLLYNKLSMTGI